MKELIKKYKAFILYGIFGVLTTSINIVVFLLCYKIIGLPNVPSNIIAWILAVLFAFITNKLYVFESKCMEKKTFFNELIKFTVSRLTTGFLDLLIMFITVDIMAWNAALWKIISNIIVIIANYVLSKFVVFKKPYHPNQT